MQISAPHRIPNGMRSPAKLFLIILIFSLNALAASSGVLRVTVTDPLGGVIKGAKVTLLLNGKPLKSSETNTGGECSFAQLAPGRYRVRAESAGFDAGESRPVYVTDGVTARIVVGLGVGALRQQMVVTATGEPTPQSQTGASVSVIGPEELKSLNKLDVADVLRLVPGLQVTQQGQRGSVTSLFVRGGADNFNKVVIDGIPANEIGGQFDFANLSTTGVDEVEIFKGPNSILYGSDAMAGVISLTTRHGETRTPEFTYAADGGNFNTLRQEVSAGGVIGRIDYFSDFMRFDTKNSLPNSSFHNGTYAGNFGWAPTARSSVRFTVHHDATGLGSPNALAVYGIPDDSFQREQDTYLGLTGSYQTTSHWRNVVRLTSAGNHYFFDTPAPAGFPFEGNYLGLPVSFCGANGYCASGQAILDYGGAYPSLYNSRTVVRSVRAESDYSVAPQLSLTGGFQFTHESGFTQPSSSSRTNDTRNNYDFFGEAQGSIRQRAFASAGAGIEDNALFGFAVTPRVSMAWYPRRPDSSSEWGGTKLRFNFGEGIQEPSIFQQGSSLYTILSGLENGSSLIFENHVTPVGAQRSRDFEFGADQGLWRERAQASLTFFHDRFYDLLSYVPDSALPALGVPGAVAAAVPYGAYINADSYRSQGVEAELRISFTSNLRLQASYMYLDAVVTRSFATGALSPAFNPAFPNIPIGAFLPLVGGRPFRRPPHSGNFILAYARGRFGLNLNGYFAGRSDDSTLLTDENFGNTLLLPNHNLLAGYRLIDFSGWLDVHRGVTLYTSMDNVLSSHYQSVFGYPALPFTFRAGVRFTLGGNEGL
ncbi:MAG: TonB-dependent receptor plug domain-containing protein [Acidobacteriota bacterium]|nr:TonB-dependent receptor plug domain-containing protein [Acidobacteriota bacterium]